MARLRQKKDDSTMQAVNFLNRVSAIQPTSISSPIRPSSDRRNKRRATDLVALRSYSDFENDPPVTPRRSTRLNAAVNETGTTSRYSSRLRNREQFAANREATAERDKTDDDLLRIQLFSEEEHLDTLNRRFPSRIREKSHDRTHFSSPPVGEPNGTFSGIRDDDDDDEDYYDDNDNDDDDDERDDDNESEDDNERKDDNEGEDEDEGKVSAGRDVAAVEEENSDSIRSSSTGSDIAADTGTINSEKNKMERPESVSRRQNRWQDKTSPSHENIWDDVDDSQDESELEEIQPQRDPSNEGPTAAEAEGQRDEIEEWYKEAVKLGNQEQNWDALVKNARVMGTNANSRRTVYCLKGIRSLISELRKAYQHRPPEGETQNLVDGIDRETTAIFEKVWHLAVDRRAYFQDQVEARGIIDAFEAQVIPRMVRVTMSCFKAFYVDQKLAPEGRIELLHILKMMLTMCKQVYNLIKERYVRGRSSSRRILPPLRRIIDALEAGYFEAGVHEPAELDYDTESVGAPWTDDEGLALVRGLTMFQGE